MANRRSIWFMAAIALVAAFLVACGGDEEEQPPTGALSGELEIFDLVISMTQRGPGFATDVPALYISSSDLVPAHVNGARASARVDVTEMLGSETLLHLDIGRHRLLAEVDPRTRARAGQDIQVTLDIDRLHLLDAQSERAIDKIEVPAELRESAAARLPAATAPEAVSPA